MAVEPKYCCGWLQHQATRECPDHPQRDECADVVIHQYGKRWGIPIHDGGSSFYVISFCPACGSKLS